jgi:hypothetical protein
VQERIIPIDWNSVLSQLKIFNLEWVKDVDITSHVIPISWAQGISKLHEISLVYRGILDVSSILNLSWDGELSIIGKSNVINLDFLGGVAQSSTIPIDNLQKLAKSCILLLEWQFTSTPTNIPLVWVLPIRDVSWTMPDCGGVLWTLPTR